MAASKKIRPKRPTPKGGRAKRDRGKKSQLAATPQLPPKRARFVDEYLVDLNATRAATRAGYSKKSAASQGERLLRNAQVQAAVAAGQEARGKETGITRERVLRELGIIAFSDVRHFTVSDLGELELVEGAPDEAWRAVSSVKHRITTTKTGDAVRETEYRLWSKTDALHMAGKHLGMFLDRIANPDGSAVRPGVVIYMPSNTREAGPGR